MSVHPHVAWMRLAPRPGQNIGVSTMNLIAGHGIEGDRHAKPNARNQVLLIEIETLDDLNLAPGDIRENIATSGINLMSLQEGARLRIGSEAEVVISHPCDPCHKMNTLRPGLESQLLGRRGMLGIIDKGGVVVEGDPVTIAI